MMGKELTLVLMKIELRVKNARFFGMVKCYFKKTVILLKIKMIKAKMKIVFKQNFSAHKLNAH